MIDRFTVNHWVKPDLNIIAIVGWSWHAKVVVDLLEAETG